MYCSPRTKKKRLGVAGAADKQKAELDPASLSSDCKEYVPFITTSDALLCIFCKRPTAPLIKIPSGIFINLSGYVHELCLRNKGCCECGVLGFCYRCSAKDCTRLIHSWCAQAMHGSASLCDLHSSSQKKKESSRLPFIKSICRRVISSQFWDKEYKEKDSPSSVCNGHIFWYILGLEYFPTGYDLSYFPCPPVTNQFELQYDPLPDTPNYVDQMLHKLTSDLDSVQGANSKIIKKLQAQISETKAKSPEKPKTKAKKKPKHTGIPRQKPKPEDSHPNQKIEESASNGVYHESLIKFTEDYSNSNASDLEEESIECVCEVCGDSDYEESLLTCSKCSLCVHQRCYKISSPLDWTCDVCVYFAPNTKLPCVLCPKRGGALKQSIHLVKDSSFPNYTPIKLKGKNQGKKYVWVHAFCALHTPGVSFKAPGIDLSGIETAKFSLQCEICKTREGACLQCSFNRCTSAFHPECGKDLFVSSKSSEKKIYCALHKPLKLRKMLESRHKKLNEDIYKFCKAMEKYLNKAKVSVRVSKRKRNAKTRSSMGRIFTQDEDLALEYRIQQFLYRLNLSQKKPFTVSINLQASTRCSRVSIARPQFYTLIVPSVIVEEGISIEGRSPEECFKRYQDTLFSKLKNEILMIGNRLCVYQGNEAGSVKHYTRHKKKPSEYSLRVSQDTYCICNQPYYYEIPWDSELTQEQWEEKVKDNEMVECTKCEKWYHLKCVKYEGSLEKAQQDENWKCGICDKKKVEKVKYLDQKSIISDINQGVVTRRGTKIY